MYYTCNYAVCNYKSGNWSDKCRWYHSSCPNQTSNECYFSLAKPPNKVTWQWTWNLILISVLSGFFENVYTVDCTYLFCLRSILNFLLGLEWYSYNSMKSPQIKQCLERITRGKLKKKNEWKISSVLFEVWGLSYGNTLLLIL